MNKEMITKIEELLDDSYETFTDKVNFSKTQKKILDETSKRNGLEKSLLKKITNFMFYKGKGWENNNPLKLDKTAEEKDKLTPIFSKLRDIIVDFTSIGAEDELKSYLDELEKCGIKITFNDMPQMTINDSHEVIMDALDSACKLQTNINTLDKVITEDKSTESEEIGFTPKSSFKNTLGYYAKIKDGKGDKVEDKMQSEITKSLMINNALSYLVELNDKEKESDD